ncbi:MAG: hypothetical protein CMK89_07755 [Pseudomonadales bacterium]|nr:hypothetical protein [Pseudomonadales bacterium]
MGVSLFILLFAITLVAYVYGDEVILLNGLLIRKKLFFIERKILLTDIKDYRVNIGVFKYSDRMKPTIRLEIYDGDGKSKICIPIKLYPREFIGSLQEELKKMALSK